ncbi:Protein-tyrosine sulfotransferase [Hondaea fermentalgiana]|uniref:protein-tyrosine sulfotransferase n=1 Tax=Hondaea fermentalgiana TaxID=2315210 RepID=A0A2R5G2U0_9STRA|nr:Protein-tyrosine sulfotransferase [Hondaea fermentalgiana]|eukprot:GBG24639.1 Protein-tyrosine sulfotransferase [Hondaea fermentalgiana]
MFAAGATVANKVSSQDLGPDPPAAALCAALELRLEVHELHDGISKDELRLAERCANAATENAKAWATLGRARSLYGLTDREGKPTQAMEAFKIAYMLDPTHFLEEYTQSLAACAAYERIFQILNSRVKANVVAKDTSQVRLSARIILRWAEAAAIAELETTETIYERLSAWVRQRGEIEVDAPDAEHVSDVEYLLSGLSNRLSSYDLAWSHASRANTIRREQAKERDEAARRDLLARAYLRGATNTMRRLGFSGQPRMASPLLPPRPLGKPLFIVGLERSGSTLLEQMLSMHPEIHGLGETMLFDTLAAPKAECSDGFELNMSSCVLDVNSTIEDASSPALYLEAISELYFDQAGEDAARSTRMPRYLTDKLPLNWRHIPMMHAYYPDVKILVMRRDPRDVLVSQFMASFHGIYGYHALHEDWCAQRIERFAHTMDLWSSLGHHWLDVSYEDLVRDPRRVLGNVLTYLELEWNEDVLRHETSTRTPQTLSRAQVSQALYSKSTGRWRRYARHLPPLDFAPLAAEDEAFCST